MQRPNIAPNTSPNRLPLFIHLLRLPASPTASTRRISGVIWLLAPHDARRFRRFLREAAASRSASGPT
jgi:hypothetical protein